MLTDVELAWAAGVIDGEGCLHIARKKAKRANHTLTDQYVMVLKVTMGHEPTILRLRAMFGSGSKHKVEQSRPDRRWNLGYSWLVQSDLCRQVLTQVGPYLFTKRAECDVALRFLALPKWGGGHHRGPKSPEFLAQQEALWDEMRRLKPRTRLRLERDVATHSIPEV